MIKNEKKSLLKKILRLAVLILCGATVGINVYLANASSLIGNKLPMPFGYGAAVVLSGSMEPELSKGDLIIVKPTDALTVGKVVVFQDGRSLVVHRIIEENGDEITTQGDANNTADAPIKKAYVKGEVILAIPYVGTAVELIKTPIGTILILALAFLLMEAPRFKKRQKQTDEIDKIKEEIRRLKQEKGN